MGKYHKRMDLFGDFPYEEQRHPRGMKLPLIWRILSFLMIIILIIGVVGPFISDKEVNYTYYNWIALFVLGFIVMRKFFWRSKRWDREFRDTELRTNLRRDREREWKRRGM